LLAADASWQDLAGEGGALEALNEEQTGALCGPKPPRAASLMEMSGALDATLGGAGGAGGAGGLGMMSGRELLAMLQSLNAQTAESPSPAPSAR